MNAERLEMQEDQIGEGLAAVAQALINIAEGFTTIEKGSPVYRKMELLMQPEIANAMRAAPRAVALLSEIDRAGNANTQATKSLAAKAGGILGEIRRLLAEVRS